MRASVNFSSLPGNESGFLGLPSGLSMSTKGEV